MTLKDALLTHQAVKRPLWDNYFIYFKAKTGPYQTLVDCDYFVYYEDAEPMFSTSIDLYAEDLMAEDYELVPKSKQFKVKITD